MKKQDRLIIEAMRSRIEFMIQMEEIAAEKTIEILIINNDNTITLLEEI